MSAITVIELLFQRITPSYHLQKKDVFMWREFIKYMINEATLKAI